MISRSTQQYYIIAPRTITRWAGINNYAVSLFIILFSGRILVEWILFRVKVETIYRVDLTQLIRFLVVELIQLCLNLRFDISVIFMINYSFI
jgi:hypothetical protein